MDCTVIKRKTDMEIGTKDIKTVDTLEAIETENNTATLAINPLESEAIYIFREVVAQFEKPVLLFSGGKDSITLVRLAQKAFYPAKIPFPLLHIDTGHNFPETIAFRDKLVKELGVELIIRYVQDSIDQGKVIEEKGKYASRNSLQTTTLLDALDEFKFDAAIGGARRDEEKARAKERIFSVRDDFGQWDEKNQRPELFDHLNGKISLGQNVRVFPISNWTELDVWSYIAKEKIEIPSIYFAHTRKTFVRDGMIWSADKAVYREEDEVVEERLVRFRTVGDMSCTAAVLSDAATLEKVVQEIRVSTISERGARIDDKRSEAAMEKRKQQGYF
ncbi:sulfate adenylyltransferase subunit CysD [uncultured Dokdonia sp.]|uniref:sulfate adenylyltransferase subunit CysD n=1 Tax=uncultured Dokdonia sp. TaxID=575653 RepID=UPI0026284047|nr:sulfate adenylyltransferase subunit CysD [uncultured Dokdonia sp.]